MKIIPKQKLLDVDGTLLKNGDENLTVGFILTFAINQSKTVNPVLAYKIMLQCNKEKEFELTSEQSKQVKEEVTEFAKSERRYFGNNVWGQIIDFLDGGKLETIEKPNKEKVSKK